MQPDTIKKIAVGGAVAAILAAAGLATLFNDGYKTISWDRPNTDAEWAEDIKQENLDQRSTEVLEQMLETHKAKLERLAAEYKKYEECADCYRYPIETSLKDSNVEASDKVIDEQFDQMKYSLLHDIELLSRSIERMENELRLRAEGFVVPDKNKAGVLTPEAELEAVESDKIREIHD